MDSGTVNLSIRVALIRLNLNPLLSVLYYKRPQHYNVFKVCYTWITQHVEMMDQVPRPREEFDDI